MENPDDYDLTPVHKYGSEKLYKYHLKIQREKRLIDKKQLAQSHALTAAYTPLILLVIGVITILTLFFLVTHLRSAT